MPHPITQLIQEPDYHQWLAAVKQRIHAARMKIALAANSELISLYYELGAQIVERENHARWGSGFIDAFSCDLKKEFPGVAGFSPKNLRYCRAFFRFYGDESIWQQAVAKLESETWAGVAPDVAALISQIPWGHNIQIFTKLSNLQEARFYIRQTIENGWSRDVLAVQIKSGLYARVGKAVTNFAKTMPPIHSDLAQQTLKDPYAFDFMTMTTPYNERDIEDQLMRHLTQFLLELGKGFAFIGRQYHMEVDGTDYYLDLLFYHVVLKCYVVIELKNRKFIPEFAGKLNFYLSAVDSLLKRSDDQPTIGLLLCRDKSNIEVEFALRDINKPMGISEYNLVEALPDNLKGSLPTVEEIEADLKSLTTEQPGRARKTDCEHDRIGQIMGK